MAEDFKLPASSYETLVKIIKAYGHSHSPMSNQEIADLCGLSPFDVSRNSGFLSSISIIAGTQKKEITERGKNLSLSLEHNIDYEIVKNWKEILLDNDFIKKIITAIKIRNGMDFQGLNTHIAYSSGQRNNQYVKAGSSTIVELLKLAEIVRESDGKIIVNSEDQTANEFENIENKKEVVPQERQIASIKKMRNREFPQMINVNIEIKIETNVNELDELKIKLKAFLNEFKALNNI
jgi:hypothetical protein